MIFRLFLGSLRSKEGQSQPMHLLLQPSLAPAQFERVLGEVRALSLTWGGEVVGTPDYRNRSMQLSFRKGVMREDLRQGLLSIEGVEAFQATKEPLFHVGDPCRGALTVQVEDAIFGGGFASAIAGPCSVEDHETLLTLAKGLKQAGATALRGGAFKPRTSPYAFQGLGRPGLEILSDVARQTGLAVVTEALDPKDLDAVGEHAHILQIGSRNMMNYALLKEVGQMQRPVLLKRGMSATLSEFLNAAEYLADAGSEQILLCERGLRHFDPAVRNLLDLSAIPLLKARTHLPVLVDPSHGTGVASVVPAMMHAAAAAGADGFLVEVHLHPEQSISDAGQALSLDTFAQTLPTTALVLEACGRRLSRSNVSSSSNLSIL
ncbi:MAG: 3-deoxy-7-phosphoheptulonate synthase [Planctomycetota bacterium]|nr:3-deoxy-7-phosphoheptulonate synthase [Planctomycetota bacterium]